MFIALRKPFAWRGRSWVLAPLLLLPFANPRSSSFLSNPDVLLLNAHVITMVSSRPMAEAIAVSGDRDAWVGSEAEAHQRFPKPARVVDLHGATVLPGIIDAHTHLLELGKSLLQLNLKDVLVKFRRLKQPSLLGPAIGPLRQQRRERLMQKCFA